MIYVFFGFVFGSLIPYMARRFAKFMPATPAYAMYRLLKPVRIAKNKNAKYIELQKAYLLYSVGFGIVTAALSGLAYEHFSVPVWAICYVWILLLLLEIDKRMMLLPDILTIPLLLLGLCFSIFSGAWVGIPESVFGAVVGYVLPVVASVFLVWKYPDAFGGGDIKLLMSIGAWIGAYYLVYVILTACVLFTIKAIILKKRAGVFGPELAVAAIAVAFICF